MSERRSRDGRRRPGDARQGSDRPENDPPHSDDTGVNPQTADATHLPALATDKALSLLSATADLTLLVDRKDVVRRCIVGAETLDGLGLDTMVGRRWADCVTVESRPKIEMMLRDVREHGRTRWRQVNHPVPGQTQDLPVQYRLVALADGAVAAVGREQRTLAAMQQRLAQAQRMIEREYRDLRHADQRYRMLFQLATDAVLIIDLASRRIVESNPESARLFGREASRLNGRTFPLGFSEPDDREIIGWLQRLHVDPAAGELRGVIKGSTQQCVLSASAFRQDRQVMALVRVRPIDTAPDALVVTHERGVLLEGAEALGDGLVVTDTDGRIVIANPMFLELTQLPGAARAIGEPIERWLGRPGVDMALMIAALGDRGVVAGFPTVLQSEFGGVHSVEVSASVLPGSGPLRYVFGIRDVGARMGERTAAGSPALDRGSVEHLTELVGRVPLKEIVRETDDLIERMCIETALELSNDNRAMAAEMLGLSRQSLYVKMRRFGIGDLDAGDA